MTSTWGIGPIHIKTLEEHLHKEMGLYLDRETELIQFNINAIHLLAPLANASYAGPVDEIYAALNEYNNSLHENERKDEYFLSVRLGVLGRRVGYQFNTLIDWEEEKTMTAYHTPQCLEIQALDKIWVQEHPRYCRHCNGYGQFTSSYDPSPVGVSLASGWMTDVDPCPECTEKGLCPVCGQPGLSNEDQGRGEDFGEGPCTFCGWDYKDGGRPYVECCCHEYEEPVA